MTSHLQSLWAGFQEFLEHRVLVVWIGTELRLKELKDEIKVHINLHLEQMVPLNCIIVTNCMQKIEPGCASGPTPSPAQSVPVCCS